MVSGAMNSSVTAKKNDIANVTFLPLVEKGRFLRVIDNFDAIFIGTIESPNFIDSNMMNKMFDLYDGGLSQLCNGDNDAIHTCGERGIITKSCDNDAIKAQSEDSGYEREEELSQMGMLDVRLCLASIIL